MSQTWTERETFKAMSSLPFEVVFKILSFKPQSLQIARLVCKEWRRRAERSVVAVRVNG